MIFWGETFAGLCWLGAGFFGMFDHLLGNIINIIFLFGGIIAFAHLLRVGQLEDDGDEMSDAHYTQAKALAGRIIYILLCTAASLSAMFLGLCEGMDIDWIRIISHSFFILMGIQNLSTGLIFRKLEAE